MIFKTFRDFDKQSARERALNLVEDEWDTDTEDVEYAKEICGVVNPDNLDVLGYCGSLDEVKAKLEVFLDAEDVVDAAALEEFEYDYLGEGVYVAWGVRYGLFTVARLDAVIEAEVKNAQDNQPEGETWFEIVEA